MTIILCVKEKILLITNFFKETDDIVIMKKVPVITYVESKRNSSDGLTEGKGTTVLTSTDLEAVSAASPARITASVNTEHETHVQAVQEPKYDSITISSQTETSRFRKELVSRLEKEVRTAVSTGDIQQLKQAVEEDRYVPDPMRIAGKILLMDEEDL
jgi:anti-sigma28 factor (negative regulator of flagellin synthesis)